jgi:hypothetical protein
MKELATALAKAQAAMKPAVKDSTNPHFKSKYADLTSVWEACRDALTKNGLSVVQATEFDGDLVWIETHLLHSSGEAIKGRYPLRPQQQTPQGYGSAISYARRYALAAMVGVVADDDDGAAASERPATNGAAHYEATPASTMQGRKNEADGIKKAREWTNEAIAAIGKFKSKVELDTWIGKNTPTIDRLKEVVPEEHDVLWQRINGASDRLNTLVAG